MGRDRTPKEDGVIELAGGHGALGGNRLAGSECLWIGEGAQLLPLSAEAILTEFEAGKLSADTPVRIRRDAAPGPLHRYLRELVWIAHNHHRAPLEDPEGKSLFEVAFQYAPIGMVVSDLAGRILQVNAVFCDMLGYAREELIGASVGKLSGEDEREREITLGNEMLSGARISFQIEKRFFTKDGRGLETVLSISAARGEDGAPQQVIAHVLDMTTLKQLKRQLQNTARLQTLGRLAGGIAHDFSNLMTVILGFSRLGLEDPQMLELGDFETMHAAAEAGTRLTQQLLAFHRRGPTRVQPLNVHACVEPLIRMLRASLAEQVTVSSVLNAKNCVIEIDRARFEQVVMNLAFNARDAMPRGGALTVRTFNRDLEGVAVLGVQVADTGKGMPPEVVARAHEPFFTTRQDSGGTGLGLSTVHAVVEQCDGELDISSEVGVGTTITVYFPLVECALEAVEVGEREGSHAKRALIVDGDRSARRWVRSILTAQGWDVMSVGSASEQEELVSKFTPGDGLDLLVCELQLKDSSGIDLVRTLWGRWPELQVIFVSSMASAAVLMPREQESHRYDLLEKPVAEEAVVALLKDPAPSP